MGILTELRMGILRNFPLGIQVGSPMELSIEILMKLPTRIPTGNSMGIAMGIAMGDSMDIFVQWIVLPGPHRMRIRGSSGFPARMPKCHPNWNYSMC